MLACVVHCEPRCHNDALKTHNHSVYFLLFFAASSSFARLAAATMKSHQSIDIEMIKRRHTNGYTIRASVTRIKNAVETASVFARIIRLTFRAVLTGDDAA